MTTAVVKVRNNNGEWVKCWTLIDTCATANFMTKTLAKSLCLRMFKCETPISVLNSLTTSSNHQVSLKIHSIHNNFSKYLQFLTIDHISERIPSDVIPRQDMHIPGNLPLADPEFHKPANIDMLLGSGPTLALLCVGQHILSHNGNDLVFQKTRLGWTIGGSFSHVINLKKSKVVNCSVASLDEAITKFWETEEINIEPRLSPEEIECEKYFLETVTRNSEGRFIVALPFKENVNQLGESYSIAKKQLLSLKRRFAKNPKFKENYTTVIQESIDLGHMSVVENSDKKSGFFMPHHAVFKESSSTTKTRVVLNGSAESSTGVSLNDTLMVGPTLQNSIFVLHLRFRLHNIALTADIEKMYKQILVRPSDRKYQRILWFFGDEIVTLESNTVTFGESAALYLAIRYLYKLADKEQDRYPIWANVIKKDTYVDDLNTGAQTVADALKIREECTKLLKAGGFNIRQWASNNPEVLSGLDQSQINSKLNLDKDEVLKTLGVFWNAKLDLYAYSVQKIINPEKITKRTIMSEIAKLYDPLGLLGPIILYAKLIIQRLWQANVEWDESIPTSIHTSWVKFCSQLPFVNNITFERRVITADPSEIEIHGFCDASEAGYGACVYIRSSNNLHTQSRLYCAKSRVAPIKLVSLPRLELNAARLLTKLINEVVQSIKIDFDNIYFWTDSTIVIQWLRKPVHILKSFVANRVAFIQANSKTYQWNHVRSSQNPADALSRGQLPKEFMKNNLWREGPSWLKTDKANWPKIALGENEFLPEIKKHFVLLTSFKVSETLEFFKKFSSYHRLLRVQSYVYRLLRSKTRIKYHGKISCKEYLDTEIRLLKFLQHQYFEPEIKRIKGGKNLHKCRLSYFDPFLDNDDVLRVGGRLKNSHVSFNNKHPIFLPSYNHVTDLIIEFYHRVNCHAGIQTTLYAIRQKFWLLDGRNQVRKIVRKCIICTRANPVDVHYKMGNLPAIRFQQVRAFYNVGVDYCGPFSIKKEKKFRNQKRVKVYVAVFVCMSVKATHLEVVSDLSTEAFLAALKRFVARRGRPQSISSDNGSNFRGAKNELRELYELFKSEAHQNKVISFLEPQQIKWNFIPPLAPNFGGLWESTVKIFKHHFKRVAYNTLFTFEEFNTLTIEIEAIMNSRPITPISNDPNDLIALTPGHFLIGDSLNSLPDPDLLSTPVNRLSQWQHLTQLKQNFWKRWNQEYINELNIRHKWHSGNHDLNVGSMVVIKEKNVPSMHWILGRITNTHPGNDKVIRTVTVKTANGEFVRSVKSLAPLPIN